MATRRHTRRPLALLLLVLLGVGCAGSTTAPSDSSAVAAAAQRGVIGSPITLAGGSERLMVTPVAVIDPASVGSALVQPRHGDRYVAVALRVRNVAAARYTDSPANGATLTAANGETYSPTVNPAGHAFGTPTLREGQSRVGVLTFEIPTGVAARQFRLTLESGFGHASAWWTIPQSAHPSSATLGAAGLGSSTSGIGRTLVISGNVEGDQTAVTPLSTTRLAHQVTVTLTAQAVGNTPPALSEDMAPGGGLRLTLVDAHGTAVTARSIAMPAMIGFQEFAALRGVATFDVPAGFVPATFQAVLTEGGVQAAVWRLAAD